MVLNVTYTHEFAKYLLVAKSIPTCNHAYESAYEICIHRYILILYMHTCMLSIDLHGFCTN